MTANAPTRPAARSWLRLPRRSARLRLTAFYGALFLCSGAALLGATYVLFERATEFSKPHLPAIPHTPAITPLRPASQLSVPSGFTRPLELPTALSTLKADQSRLSEAQRRLVLLYGGAKPGVGPRLTVLQPQLSQDERQLRQDQHQLALAVHQVAEAVHQVAQAGSVQSAQRAADSHQLLVDSGIALALVGVLAILAGWLVAGRMLRPIRTITRTARRISSTSLHERLALDGPEDELKELGDTLDDLFARLEAAFEAQRRFVANASHELRTPLTRERVLVQVALGDPSTPEVWRTTGHELLVSNREQEALIEALLTLASSEGGFEHSERADLADICRAVLEQRGREPAQSGVRVERALRSAPLDGDPRLIERLVANLVDNGVAHNVPGGRVQVASELRERRAVLSVTNTGPVIPAAELERLFQPFQRLDGRRTQCRTGHHGLGLSIVRAIAAAHQATVTAEPLPEGGLSLTVAFPSPASAESGAPTGA